MSSLWLHLMVYLLFFALLGISKTKRGVRLFDKSGFVHNPTMLLLLHVAGILLFGFLPIFFLRSSPLVPTLLHFDIFHWEALVTVILVGLTIFISLKLAHRTFHAEIGTFTNPIQTGTSFFILYFFFRLLFIIAYEGWFRGYLLQDSIHSFGWTWSVLINVVGYSLLHLVNSREEALVCIPFGLILCFICAQQNTPWPAIFIHLALTITYEISFVYKTNTHQKLQHENINNRRFWLSR